MRESAREDNSLTINIRLHLRHISGLSSKAKSLTVSLDPSISVAKVRELLADAMALPTEELVFIKKNNVFLRRRFLNFLSIL